nr:MAG TPA: hypothetical protein [Caudoviricetes sp.]
MRYCKFQILFIPLFQNYSAKIRTKIIIAIKIIIKVLLFNSY